MNNRSFKANDIKERTIALNLVMCDKKCKHQDDGYCTVKECRARNLDENCPYFEEEKKGVAVEFPQREPIEEIPSIMPDLPTTLPQQRLL